MRASIEALRGRYPEPASAVLPALRLAQEEHGGWLPPEALREVAEALEPPVSAKGIQLLGPAPSPIPLVKRKHHYQVLLKMTARFPVGDFFPPLLRPLRDVVRRHGVRMEADVDPYNMMV